MTPLIRTRPVREEDEPFLRSLFDAAEEERLLLGLLNQADHRAILDFQYAGFRAHYRELDVERKDVLLTWEERPVGRMIILQNSEEIRLAELMLTPEIRGRGLGSAMIQTLQAESQMSHRPLRALVFKLNRAKRLYDRLGFYKIEENPTHILMEWTHRLQGSSI